MLQEQNSRYQSHYEAFSSQWEWELRRLEQDRETVDVYHAFARFLGGEVATKIPFSAETQAYCVYDLKRKRILMYSLKTTDEFDAMNKGSFPVSLLQSEQTLSLLNAYVPRIAALADDAGMITPHTYLQRSHEIVRVAQIEIKPGKEHIVTFFRMTDTHCGGADIFDVLTQRVYAFSNYPQIIDDAFNAYQSPKIVQGMGVGVDFIPGKGTARIVSLLSIEEEEDERT